jgi:hypothetical protein
MTVSLRLVRRLAAITLLAAAPMSVPADDGDEGGIELRVAKVRQADDVYVLDAVADIRLTDAVERALDNGVALTFAWRIEITRARDWLPDATTAALNQRYTLQYHALSLQYVVTNRNTGERRSFTRRRIALDSIATLIGLPLVDRVLLDDPSRHTGHVRVALEHDSLPLPLRPQILFNPAWYLGSDWQTWSFE